VSRFGFPALYSLHALPWNAQGAFEAEAEAASQAAEQHSTKREPECRD
jgi:hypothetical protein